MSSSTVWSPYTQRLIFVSAEHVRRLGEEKAKAMVLRRERSFLVGLGKLSDSIHDICMLADIESKSLI